MARIYSKPILDPDYYSASTYVEQENNSSYVRLFVQILIAGLIIVGAVLLYKYLNKNNYFESTKDFTVKIPTVLSDKETTRSIVREEAVEVTETKVRDVAPIVKVVEIEKKEAIKVYAAPKRVEKVTTPIKPQVASSNELSDEYIKLVKESLGNY